MKVVFIVFGEYNWAPTFLTEVSLYSASVAFLFRVWLSNTGQRVCKLFKAWCKHASWDVLETDPLFSGQNAANGNTQPSPDHSTSATWQHVRFCVYGGWLLEVSTGNPDRLLGRNWRLKIKALQSRFTVFPCSQDELRRAPTQPLCHYLQLLYNHLCSNATLSSPVRQ